MSDIQAGLTQWGLDVRQVRKRVYRAASPRARERWHALWLLAQGWSANNVAVVLDRDAHTIGQWLLAFCAHGPTALAFKQTGGPPRLRRGCAGWPESGGADDPGRGRHRLGELELEGGPAVH